MGCQAQGGGEVVAWMRRWAFDKVGVIALPKKERPRGWHLLPVTPTKALDDDVPLYAAPPSAPVGVEGLRRMVEKLAAHVRPTCCELWEEAQAALAQQPASDGGFTAADMMDARQEGRKEAQQPAAVDGVK